MNALILAGGYGKRLKKFTKHTPKCLLPIKGVPLLDLWIKTLLSLKVSKILINTHYKSEQVKKFINNQKYKKKIILKHEKKLLGTGGTIYKNINFLKKSEALILHADNYTKDNLKSFIDFHKIKTKKKMILSILAFKSKNFRNEGILKINREGILKNIYEKKNKKYGNLANGAIYLFNKKGLNLFKKKYDNKKDFTKSYLKYFINKSAVYKTKKIFVDIGTEKNYQKFVEKK